MHTAAVAGGRAFVSVPVAQGAATRRAGAAAHQRAPALERRSRPRDAPAPAAGASYGAYGIGSAVLGSTALLARRAGARRVRAARVGARRAVATLERTTATPESAAQSPEPQVGDRLHGWTCVRIEDLHELSCKGSLWQHDRTGAELMSVAQPMDENKTFGVVFRTPPESSNGICHVLEHSVLCGSRKYPVKEPFVELIKGSVNTFLNAMTFPDRTCYPVASCNLQDFYNLVDVYLDAVFHPRAIKDPKIIAQEGWHYEVEEKDQPLIYKGVVFNEMKGVYSNPDNIQQRKLLNSVLPDTTYGVDSGGDPREIPNLDFEYMKEFHGRYYHPSNAKFWFYGDDPAEERLRLVDAYLQEFERTEPRSEIKQQPLWKEPRETEHVFPIGADEDASKRSMFTLSWVLAEGKVDLETEVALNVMDYVLMGTPGAPLRKALTDSGLGSRVIGGGLYDGLAQPTFSVGLKDIREEDASAVQELVLSTLQKIAEEGFEAEAVESALNRIEFQNRELNTGGFPRGLALMFAAVNNWNYGKDPFEPLRFDAPLKALRSRLEAREPVLEAILRERLLDNPHRLALTSKPSLEEASRIDLLEKEELAEHRGTLDETEIDRLIHETKELKQIQETPDTPEALESIPSLALSDIPKEAPSIQQEVGELSGATVLRHPQVTSGVVYVDMAFDLRGVAPELLSLLPLFCRGLRELGVAKSDFVQLGRRIDLSTGGVSASANVMSRRGSAEPVAYLFMRGKAMEGKVDSLLDIMAEMAMETRWDNRERFLQLVKEAHAGGRSMLISSGHGVAAGRLGRQFTKAGWASSQMGGLTQFQANGELLKEIESDWPAVEAKLRALQACVFRRGCTVGLTADAETLPRLNGPLGSFLGRLPEGAAERRDGLWGSDLRIVSEGIIVPSQVNYVGKGANLYQAGYELHGSAVVTSKLLGTTWLWDRVRVSGGAYGGFCSFDIRSGDFKYLSYRDPNLLKTVENYDGTAEFLRGIELSDAELVKSVIGTMGDVDTYQLPDAKGMTAMSRYLLGETHEMRQELRDQVLGTDISDLQRFGEAIEGVKSGPVCVVGGEAAVRDAAETLGLELSSPLAAAKPAAAKPAAAKPTSEKSGQHAHELREFLLRK